MRTEHSLLPVCVIGSGLSGVSVAKGLEGTGCKVLMLDAGLEYSQREHNIVSTLSQTPAWTWKEADRELLRSGVESSTSGVKEKLQYGSNYSSRSLDVFPIGRENSRLYTSFARGGLSNIWGAGLLPMHADDMSDWPISLEDLVPHYKEVLRFMPMAGQHDMLEQLLPLYCEPHGHGPSRQAASMMAHMKDNRAALEAQGLYFGASRLAAQYHGCGNDMECQYCGMCMYGCPYNVLYSSKNTLKDLEKGEHFTYRSNFVITHFEESENKVRIYGIDKKGQKQEPVDASRLILAAGAPATTKIVLSSLRIFDKPVRMLTSDQYYMPLLSWSGQNNIEHEALHTMCQNFWVMQNRTVSPYLVHFSLYTYNDLYRQAIQGMLGKAFPLFSGLAKVPLKRLFFMFCYLHSSESGSLTATLSDDKQKTFVIKGLKNSSSRKTFAKALQCLKKNARLTGLYPLPFYKGEKPPGAGNHFGGSFPMAKSPNELQTDQNGCLYGMDRVYLADSSVFPSITATTISLSVMANAHRVGRYVSKMPAGG